MRWFSNPSKFSTLLSKSTLLRKYMEILFVCFQAKELCLRVFARYPEFSGCTELSSFELMSDPKYCGKMKVLDKLLGIFRTEHSKVLLFSRSTQVRIVLTAVKYTVMETLG